MVTQFEYHYGHDIPLARKMVDDPFKAPEQHLEAKEFLESLISVPEDQTHK